MANRWYMVLLGLIVSQGFHAVAMEKKAESPRTPRRNQLSCSSELKIEEDLIKKVAALSMSAERRKEKSITPINMYYAYPGSSSPVEYSRSRYSISDSMKPIYWREFPGH